MGPKVRRYRDKRGRFARRPAPAKPVPAKPVPTKRKPVPTKRKPVPTKRKPVPTKPVPTKRKLVPTKRKPAPAKPAPTKRTAPKYVVVPTRSGDRVRDARTGRFVSKGRKRPARVVGKRKLQGDLMRRTPTTVGRFFGEGLTATLERVNFWSAINAAIEGERIAYQYRGKVYRVNKGSEGYFLDKLRDIFDRYVKNAKAAHGDKGGSFPQLMVELVQGNGLLLYNLDRLEVDDELLELTGDIEDADELNDELGNNMENLFNE